MKKNITCMILLVIALVLTGCGSSKENEVVSTDGSTSMSKVIGALSETFENETGIRVKVTLVEPKSLPRYEGKAKRVIDERNLH